MPKCGWKSRGRCSIYAKCKQDAPSAKPWSAPTDKIGRYSTGYAPSWPDPGGRENPNIVLLLPLWPSRTGICLAPPFVPPFKPKSIAFVQQERVQAADRRRFAVLLPFLTRSYSGAKGCSLWLIPGAYNFYMFEHTVEHLWFELACRAQRRKTLASDDRRHR